MPGLIARFDAPAGLSPSCFSPRCRYAARQAFDYMAASSHHARAAARFDLSAGFQCEDWLDSWFACGLILMAPPKGVALPGWIIVAA
jgi:hypothetical protein